MKGQDLNSSKRKGREIINLIVSIVVLGVGCVDIIRYVMLGEAIPLITIGIIEILFFLLSYIVWRTERAYLFLIISVAGGILFYITNNLETTLFNSGFLVQAVVTLGAGIIGIIRMMRKEVVVKKMPITTVVIMCLLIVCILGSWQVNTFQDKNAVKEAKINYWAVPEMYDSKESSQPGTVETITYETKAYATDQRTVTKTACVYLPYEYDESKSYNILYLMHGTGDDEEYWLKKNPQNKIMIDRMIEENDISPLIIVTPTFYVEDDCSDGLDPLTYSFKEELQNDLMPAVEEKYATYAKTCDEKGFKESRDHRAFAGLSRGAVTMYHSVLCGSLEYFSWFGAFSGSRTEADYFKDTIQSEEMIGYPINYLYVSSGNFDFALPGQIKDYQALLSIEPRLEKDINTSFDVYPMRYHSIGSWHLALYNYLQKIF